MLNKDGKAQQWLAALTLDLLSISNGLGCGWASPAIPQLRSNHPPFGNVPMSENQVSWIAGLLPIGGLLTIPFCGIICERVGRRNFALLTGLPHILSWLLITFAPNYIYVYAARLIAGMAGGMTLFIVPIYIGEIASDDIRGTLGYVASLCLNVGVLCAYVAGAYLSYRLLAIFCLLFPVAFFVFSIFFLPETPGYLVRKNRQIEARKSLMFLRNNNPSLVDEQLAGLEKQLKDVDREAKKLRLSDFWNDRATRRGLIISFGLLAGQQLSGIFAMLSYAKTIFELAGSRVSSDISSIIIGAILITGDCMAAVLIDRAGRRRMALISSFGTVVSHAIVGGFFYLERRHYNVSSFSWLPLVALSSYIITYVLGMSGVPFIIVSEVFRSDVSSSATTICCTLYWAIILVSTKIFDLAMLYLSPEGCFFILAGFCTASFVFIYFMLPETKGRSRVDIVEGLAALGNKSHCREKSREVGANVTQVTSSTL